MICTVHCLSCIIIFFHLTTAHLSQKETLKNLTECDLHANITLTCAGNEMIAIHSLQYAYHVRCEGICCNTYTSTDCFVNAGDTDIQDIRRACSGRSSCNAPTLLDKIDFSTCSLGVKDISYIFLQYFCIPKERIASICTKGQTLTSGDAPLYLTNENYPSVTTGSTSCSCSLEAYSCSSSINMYILDADLYLDTSACYQTLEFLDGSNKTLHTIGCESHDLDHIESSTASSHYLKIDFINNSTSNQEGYFFIGLEASVSGESFSLSCSFEQETWCVGCGDVPVIANGNIQLSNVNNSSYGAAANVTCDSGYETNTPTINCLANGTWPAPVCTEKVLFCPEGLEFCPHSNGTNVCVDKAVGCSCGTVPSIPNGVIIIEDNSTIGSVANVTCNEGYIPSEQTVTCLTTGSWEPVLCTAKDCGTLPAISSGEYELVGSSTTFGALARVICDTGYTADKQSVTCQSTGIWESAVCMLTDKSTPSYGGPKDDKPTINPVLIIVLIIIGVLLLQLGIMCYLECKIHNVRKKAAGGDSEIPKRIGMTILGSTPVLGVIAIYLTWKMFYRDVYQVRRKHIKNIKDNIDNKEFSKECYKNVSWIKNENTSYDIQRNETRLERHDAETDQKTNNSHTENNTGIPKQSSPVTAASSSEHDGDVSSSKNGNTAYDMQRNETMLELRDTETDQKTNSSHAENNTGIQKESSKVTAASSSERDGRKLE
ncbi:uncharacterized protein LOC123561349 [Mercenaria mercenaria]|uniref:uncharacterized protein LOC123561349 n=1 Tax=Mercenaria mercenaria TaxID=6596 RepID=UPI00234EFEB3|nr:uncharacterized protein LOC123561349 [Mercenaria mercenaria]